ncbi:MAG: GNAT family N-acetyltransferase [Magnetospirillum sp. 64-120]|nr:MAG: GNAT family N-acetyltransferase [Magnetospirillum sp. 64-120]
MQEWRGSVQTERLVLRAWRPEDLAAFRIINADREVMALMPSTLDDDQSDAQALRIMDGIATRGWGLWAVEVPGIAPFIGYVGLNEPAQPMPFQVDGQPGVELAWRLSRHHWGRGYASEAARTCLDFAFDTLQMDEVVAYTVPHNVRSRAVMERIGMQRDLDGDFDHPILAPGHSLRRHVLYRKRRP